MLIDTHCHIHSKDYELPVAEVLDNAQTAGVAKMICVGTDEADSALAVAFVKKHSNCFASVGLHPHDAKLGQRAYEKLAKVATDPSVVAIGECGLDYYYSHSSKEDQETAFRYQLELAQTLKKPLIFHVRDAFDDFFVILKDFKDIRGVVHSFTATPKELDQILDKGLHVGLNGIMTFTKDANQLAAAKAVPLERLLLETDAPFLTPTPKRGTVNQPANVELVAKFLSELRQEPLETLAAATSANACNLFAI